MTQAAAVTEATPVTSPLLPGPFDQPIRAAIAALDFEAIAAAFRAQDQFVYIERFLPPSLVEAMAAEAQALSAKQHRAFVPGFRKAGTVDQLTITAHAPALAALHWSPALLAFISRLAGVSLSFKNPRDVHAASLYYYQRPGDHVGWHFDDCGCEATLSYTATLSLVNRTEHCKAHFRLYKDHPERTPEDLVLSTVPGSLVLFCGTKAYHRITPLGSDEERITFSMAYVREGRRLRGWKRLYENVKDAVLYFGPRAIFQRNYG